MFGVYGNGFPIDSSTCIYLISLFCPLSVVRGGFLIVSSCRAVGSIPEGLGLMAFSVVPGGIHPAEGGFFFTIASAPHSLSTPDR